MALGRKNPGVFTYFGSKRNVANILAGKLKDGRPFCEVFAGGAFLTLRLASWGAIREAWLNDLDPGMAALWRVVHSKRLIEALLRRMPRTTTRRLYHEAVDDLGSAVVDIETASRDEVLELAWRKAVSLWSSYSGIGISYVRTRWPRASYVRSQLIRGHEALRRVKLRVTNWDFRRVLHAAGRYTLYLDPPYWRIRSGYLKDFQGRDHMDLALRLRERDRWLLSYDDCPAVRLLYGWATIETIGIMYSATGGAHLGTELLISPK